MHNAYTVRHTWLHDEVNFTSSSDALVAKLLITHQLSTQAVNLFLDVLHNPSFHPGEVTFDRAEDIETYVDKCRRERMVRQADRSRMIGGIPYLVLQLVLQCIGEEMVEAEGRMDVSRRLYYRDYYNKGLNRECLYCMQWSRGAPPCYRHSCSPSRRALRALAEVHSEATELSRSFLCRRLCFTDLKPQKLAEQPLWLKGSSIRTLYLKFGKDARDLKPIFHWISSDLTNLRALTMEGASSESRNIPRTLVEVAHGLRMLQALHIRITNNWDRATLVCLYQSISCIPNLSSLSISVVLSVHGDDFNEAQSNLLASISPPSSLKRLMVSLLSTHPKYFAWLLQDSSHYILEELTLRCNGPMSGFVLSLPNTLPRLKVLDVDLQPFGQIEDLEALAHAVDLEVLAHAVEACSSLEELQVTRIPVYPLPKTLQVLRIDSSYYEGYHGYSDEQLADYLNGQLNSGNIPNIREVYVNTFDEWTREIRTYFRSREICRRFCVALLPIEEILNIQLL